MRKIPVYFLAASFFSCVSAVEAAEPQMPVQAIQRGMEGTCHTVFQGSKVEPFGFRVLSLMQGMLGPGQDVILARLTGEKAEFTGVVAGMSGSPCYINGKLVGALAYRFGSFTKEPIAGITPIANMQAIFKLPAEKEPTQKQVYYPQTYRQALAQKQAQWPVSLQPISTPLSFGGFRADVLSHYLPELEKMGFKTVMGGISTPGASIANPDMPQKLEPGGAIAGQLVRGDLSIDGTGTVSYLEGDKVLAFGHPFFNEGYVQIPMATAYIHHILASEAGSYKMSQSGKTVGTITQDRLTAIYGQIGKMTPMIPVDLHIQDGIGVDPAKIHFEVFQNPGMTPLMMAMSVQNVLASRLNFNKGGTLQLEGRLRVDGQTLTYKNRYSVSETEDVALGAVQDLANALFTLWNNPFHKPNVQQLEIKAELQPESRQSMIRRIWADRDDFKPGDSFTLYLELETWRKQKDLRQFKLQIPENTPYGPLVLLAGDAKSFDALEGSVETGFSSYQDLLKQLFSKRQSSDLHLLFLTEESGLAQNNLLLTRLPASVQELLLNPETVNASIPIRSPGSEQKIPMDTDLSGKVLLNLNITPYAHAIN
ncbi:hypothetical protein COW36_13575 [bacterium (Candidatus Blackallbacteria) CG17_big_fil_post_rev_8_21_14_2_50_48_46]|uniref:Peptidase S55 domain-containing protein n=1 Tax=bacterium (Candidatus Blackallbacteria) CG17_big_fil_post_rev_8_21_14_2_50_48_46 TaxID=2014261 RepID=A0A2M7G4C8_9BACT|nr:MAG: hypothetical protein COW64_22195 [bacterium (Candidatus Blackallbacteria) CG18_big_fil_WC_8_21_14_2_50_49_26]PIW16354.1 MAG: hypothetical protein COW36_13575 [bacterium (Candidatus Blackallbacteria) CG17_big_fil_post_rev_8_21_14_2_50_48_46]PIW45368.1 MAG: hypothetical protein COW20_20810 [bacterium (Candidatus Blackallbacteria) CG13_big_fil_rev_8_21_14_2_50_49_14]